VSTLKYIVFETPAGDNLVHRVAVLFSEILVHATMAKMVMAEGPLRYSKPVSAGLYSWNEGGGMTHDHSTSMNLNSRATDRLIIEYPQASSFACATNPEVLNQTKPKKGWPA
jgi:hypothetical protein